MLKKTKAGYWTPEPRTIQYTNDIMVRDPVVMSAFEVARRYYVQGDVNAFIDGIDKWRDSQCRVVYPDAEYTSFVQNTDSLSKLCTNDLELVYPAMYIYIPKDIQVLGGPLTGYLAGVLCSQLKEYVNIMMCFTVRPPFSVCIERAEMPIDQIEIAGFGQKAKHPISNILACLNIVVNYILLMREYPDYVKKENTRPLTTKHYKSKEYIFSPGAEMKLKQRVVEKEEDYQSVQTGEHRAAHWRRAHWRRQFHKEGWNPDWKGKIGKFEDGRLYHLVYIPLQKVAGKM